jgi:hypothetical protein
MAAAEWSVVCDDVPRDIRLWSLCYWTRKDAVLWRDRDNLVDIVTGLGDGSCHQVSIRNPVCVSDRLF